MIIEIGLMFCRGLWQHPEVEEAGDALTLHARQNYSRQVFTTPALTKKNSSKI